MDAVEAAAADVHALRWQLSLLFIEQQQEARYFECHSHRQAKSLNLLQSWYSNKNPY